MLIDAHIPRLNCMLGEVLGELHACIDTCMCEDNLPHKDEHCATSCGGSSGHVPQLCSWLVSAAPDMQPALTEPAVAQPVPCLAVTCTMRLPHVRHAPAYHNTRHDTTTCGSPSALMIYTHTYCVMRLVLSQVACTHLFLRCCELLLSFGCFRCVLL